MSEINIVYGPNKYIYDSYLDKSLKELDKSFHIEKICLTKKGSSIDDFVSHFSSFNLFYPKRFFIVDIYKEDLLEVIELAIKGCNQDKQVIFYCPDLFINEKRGSKKSKESKKGKKVKISDSEIINNLEQVEKVELIPATFIYDFDEAIEFCHSLIESYGLAFESKEDLELTVEHLIFSSQLTLNSKGELAYIDCKTELDNILYEQNFIKNNLYSIKISSSDLDSIKYSDIEPLIFSTVQKTQTKQFLSELFNCRTPREAGKLLTRELSTLKKQEVRNFLYYFMFILEQNLNMVHGQGYNRYLVKPIRNGKLKIIRADEAYNDICDLYSNYMYSSETYINNLKLILYRHFSA